MQNAQIRVAFPDQWLLPLLSMCKRPPKVASLSGYFLIRTLHPDLLKHGSEAVFHHYETHQQHK